MFTMKNKRIQIATDLPREVNSRLAKAARKEGRTVANYIRLRLIEHVKSLRNGEAMERQG